MKDNPKFQGNKHGRNYGSQNDVSFEDQLFDPEFEEITPGDNCPMPTSTTSKRPMGRDAAKRARKSAGSNSTADFANSMHDLLLKKFTDNDNNRKARQEAYLEWKKQDGEDARQDRKILIEIEKAKLELEQKKVAIREQLIALEQKKIEIMYRQEDERILAMKLDEIEEPRRSYYAAMQKDILSRVSTPSSN